MWMAFGISAGIVLGFYDFWTKKAMMGNDVIPLVFWSSLFGALLWLPAFFPLAQTAGMFIDLAKTNPHEQLTILLKGAAMTASWIFAYFAVRELPLSFAGAVRASGPIWTMLGGLLIFGEYLTLLQLSAVICSVLAYYVLSIVGKQEGISVLKSRPLLMMLIATLLSAMTTVYDKFIVQNLGIPIYSVQGYSAIHRFLFALVIFAIAIIQRPNRGALRWNWFIPLVGIAWVAAELIYFFALESPEANVTYLSIFRRTSLVVGFALSVIFIGEKAVFIKSCIIGVIILSTILLLINP